MKTAIGLLAPGLATFAAWQLTLGVADSPYSVALVAVLVLVLVGIGVATGWWLREWNVLIGCASAAAGISTGCYVDWSDDTTGLFMVGWSMVTVGASAAAFVVIFGTALVREARSA